MVEMMAGLRVGLLAAWTAEKWEYQLAVRSAALTAALKAAR
jgi:hypothetical protein